MPDGHAKPIKVLVGQLAENFDVDVVLRETLSVLGHTELIEPIRNLLHRRPRANLPVATKAETLALLSEKL
jgi:hypothetical protein